MANKENDGYVSLEAIQEESVYPDVDATQARYEAAGTTDGEGDRPTAPFNDCSTNLPSPQKIMRIEAVPSCDSVETVPAENDSPNSPCETVVYTPEGNHMQENILPCQFRPILASSTPNTNSRFSIPPPVILPPMPSPIRMHMIPRANMMTPNHFPVFQQRPTYGFNHLGFHQPQQVPNPFDINNPAATHTYWRGPVLNSPYLSAIPNHPRPPVFHLPTKPNSSIGTQTNSGVLVNYLRPLHGSAGLPDSRIMCPVCGREEWHVDIITKDNAIIPAPQPHGVLDSRLTCRHCKSSVWQTELLTETYPYIYVPPVEPSQAHWTDYSMPSRPPHLATATARHCNGVETSTMDSGIQCSFFTPDLDSNDAAGSPPSKSERGQHGGLHAKESYANIAKLSGRRLNFDKPSSGKWISSFTRLQ